MYKIYGTKIQNFISFLAIDMDYHVIKDWKTEKIENISYFFWKILEILRNFTPWQIFWRKYFQKENIKISTKFVLIFGKIMKKEKQMSKAITIFIHFFSFMCIYKPLFRELITKHDLKIDKRVLEKILSWKWTIHYNTAVKIQKELQRVIWKSFPLRNLFFLDELKWYEEERKVVYEYSGNPLTKEEWISVVRFVIEGRWDA